MTRLPVLARRLRHAPWLLTTLVALLASSASPAAAQVIAEGGGTGVVSSGPTQQWRLNAYGVLRGGGDWRGRTNGPDFNSDMRVGGGVATVRAYLQAGLLVAQDDDVAIADEGADHGGNQTDHESDGEAFDQTAGNNEEDQC